MDEARAGFAVPPGQAQELELQHSPYTGGRGPITTEGSGRLPGNSPCCIAGCRMKETKVKYMGRR